MMFITSSDEDKGGLDVEAIGSARTSLDVITLYERIVTKQLARLMRNSANSTIIQ
jgi:hypothetical protein